MGKPVVKLCNQSTSFSWGEGKEEEGVEERGQAVYRIYAYCAWLKPCYVLTNDLGFGVGHLNVAFNPAKLADNQFYLFLNPSCKAEGCWGGVVRLLPPFALCSATSVFLCDDTALPESSFASVAEALHVQLIVKLDFVARPTPFQGPNTE